MIKSRFYPNKLIIKINFELKYQHNFIIVVIVVVVLKIKLIKVYFMNNKCVFEKILTYKII